MIIEYAPAVSQVDCLIIHFYCLVHLTVRHILVECNHFARERKDIFGRRDVVESFRFQPTLILLFIKQIEFYYKFLIIQIVIFYLLFYNIFKFLII